MIFYWQRIIRKQLFVKPGPRNLITDVPGIAVGNAHDTGMATGVTVILPEGRVVAAADVRGGGPGTREIDALDPSNLVNDIDAIVLSGGSVFGLEAASGVTAWLAGQGRGFSMVAGVPPSPIVPSAILYDLNNGGDKDWGGMPPYRALGIEAAEAATQAFSLGNQGAGYGAMSGTYKGGLGSASMVLDGNGAIGALIAVNSFGAPVIPGTAQLWAAPFALEGELGETAPAQSDLSVSSDALAGSKRDAAKIGLNTIIGIVAVEAALTPAQAKRIAIMAHDGLARAVRPVHTPFDGDTIFVVSTAKRVLADPAALSLTEIGSAAGDVVARATARGVYEAETLGHIVGYRMRHGLD